MTEMYNIPEGISEDGDEFMDTFIKDMPSKYNLMNIAPDFGKVDDPFRELGPILVCCAIQLHLKSVAITFSHAGLLSTSLMDSAKKCSSP